jgi:hypothetical protein
VTTVGQRSLRRERPVARPRRVGQPDAPLTCQTRTVRSELALATKRPSGEKATLHTQLSWPVQVRALWGEFGVQSLTVPSQLPVASILPSDANATERTAAA